MMIENQYEKTSDLQIEDGVLLDYMQGLLTDAEMEKVRYRLEKSPAQKERYEQLQNDHQQFVTGLRAELSELRPTAQAKYATIAPRLKRRRFPFFTDNSYWGNLGFVATAAAILIAILFNANLQLGRVPVDNHQVAIVSTIVPTNVVLEIRGIADGASDMDEASMQDEKTPRPMLDLAIMSTSAAIEYTDSELTRPMFKDLDDDFVAGPAGPASAVDVAGKDGATRPMGPAGPAGVGTSDPDGPLVLDGSGGALGPARSTRIPGATGASGERGPAGPAGARGPTDPAGAAGSPGPAGAAGGRGAMGPAGGAGAAGPAGAAGAAGSTALGALTNRESTATVEDMGRNNSSSRYDPVTAGVVDDNATWADYLEYRRRSPARNVRDRDVSERYIIFVQDENNLPIHDAQVTVYVDDVAIFEARTDAGGRVLFHPLALGLGNAQSLSLKQPFKVRAQKGYVAEYDTFKPYSKGPWYLTLTDAPMLTSAQLDLLFLVDATGSMGDEIAKLKASMADIAYQIARLQVRPDVRYGLVHYRDIGDQYVVRTHDFTHQLNQFQSSLAAVQASGGGDGPESLNEALHRSLNDLSWRGLNQDEDTIRLIILVADAPPHLDYRSQNFSYETDMVEAVGMGIKIFPVGASGLGDDGEFIYRQLAQFTGGKFVFLTYQDGSNPSSGPGTETEHDVDNYSVNTLDKLVVRLVSDELAKLNTPIVIE